MKSFRNKQLHLPDNGMSGLSSTTSAPDERFKLFDRPLTSSDSHDVEMANVRQIYHMWNKIYIVQSVNQSSSQSINQSVKINSYSAIT